MPELSQMLKGISSVLAACMVWGLIFIIPGLMTGFNAVEVALGRYFFLGIVSCALIVWQGWRKWRKVPRPIWRYAVFCALFVNIFYYTSLITGARYASSSVMALLMGLSAILAAFYGNWQQKECSYSRLALPSCLIILGLVCVNWTAVSSLAVGAGLEYAFGLLCGLCSLITWSWYMVANARFLREHPHVSSSDWSTLVGIATFAWVALIGILALFIFPTTALEKYTILDKPLVYFLAGGLILGCVCSWLGSYFWNYGCQLLPISLAGQLTIFETIFGLTFVYLVEKRLPLPLECVGIGCILSGASLSMHLFRASHQAPAMDASQIVT